ncbi:uncharacterized protein [Drosophila pseudoobscura]|uniref:CCHC-type domain-containing protein n=1 Tax=Drosophila pseudoobscura pseudoobscura TaxID=46245 RepID=A0A6I8W1X4_DROPS|nr:uncharacterized protein LOC117184370 [Drosophila pseudoobscura]
MAKQWINQATKLELQNYCEEFGLEKLDGLETQKKKLLQFSERADLPIHIRGRLEQLASNQSRGKSPRTKSPRQQSPKGLPQKPTMEEIQGETRTGRKKSLFPKQIKKGLPQAEAIIEKIRKWDLIFTGKGGLLEFLSRMEELAETYGVEPDHLVVAMPIILEESALDWWHTKPAPVTFISPRCQEELSKQVAERKQAETETVRDYVQEIRKLMRFGTYTEQKKLEIIYQNCRLPLKLYVKRREFQTLSEFIIIAEEFEKIETDAGHSKVTGRQWNYPQNDQPAWQRTQYRQRKCQICGNYGHEARTCSREPVLYCWTCNKQGVRTIDCCRNQPENTGRRTNLRNCCGPKPAERDNTQLIFDKKQLLGRARIGSQLMEVIIDTGATRCMINERVAEKLKGEGIEGVENRLIQLADGSTRRTTRRIQITVELGGKETTQSFLIMTGVPDTPILGIEFLKDAGTSITCGEATINFNGEPNPKRKEESSRNSVTEPTDKDVLDLNPERPMPEPEPRKPIQRGTIPGEWNVPKNFELATTSIKLVKAKLHDRPKHTQRRFKLWNEEQEACWVKIGRAGDVRISAWFQTKSTDNAPLGKEGGV